VANVASGGGLQHMHDRIALLGGRLSIDSRPGAGTVVAGVIHPVSGASRSLLWLTKPRAPLESTRPSHWPRSRWSR